MTFSSIVGLIAFYIIEAFAFYCIGYATGRALRFILEKFL